MRVLYLKTSQPGFPGKSPLRTPLVSSPLWGGLWQVTPRRGLRRGCCRHRLHLRPRKGSPCSLSSLQSAISVPKMCREQRRRLTPSGGDSKGGSGTRPGAAMGLAPAQPCGAGLRCCGRGEPGARCVPGATPNQEECAAKTGFAVGHSKSCFASCYSARRHVCL